jgi:ankyrin repeat protein
MERITMSEHDLHHSARLGDAPMIREAIRSGIALDELDDSELTPLQWALAKKQVEASLLLLELGADVAIQGRNGATALHIAIEAGANPHHRNRVNLTPLDIPKRTGEAELLRLLSESA